MSRPIHELLNLCGQIIAEQRKLLEQMESQHQAMKKLDLPTMQALIGAQEATRLRITMLDRRRRTIARQAATAVKFTGEPRLTKLAELYPAEAPAIIKLRDELKDVIEKITHRSRMSAKLSAAVLGHLNTVARLISGAIQRAGIYTKQGVRQMSGRIGVMEAVG